MIVGLKIIHLLFVQTASLPLKQKGLVGERGLNLVVETIQSLGPLRGPADCNIQISTINIVYSCKIFLL